MQLVSGGVAVVPSEQEFHRASSLMDFLVGLALLGAWLCGAALLVLVMPGGEASTDHQAALGKLRGVRATAEAPEIRLRPALAAAEEPDHAAAPVADDYSRDWPQPTPQRRAARLVDLPVFSSEGMLLGHVTGFSANVWGAVRDLQIDLEGVAGEGPGTLIVPLSAAHPQRSRIELAITACDARARIAWGKRG